jgi:hypothetical protein
MDGSVAAISVGSVSPIYGEDVHAAVTLRSGMQATESELHDCCRSTLSGFEIPERIHMHTHSVRLSPDSERLNRLARPRCTIFRSRFATPGHVTAAAKVS